MESQVVHSVRTGDAADALPGVHIGRRMTRERKDAALERAAEEQFPSVDDELRAVRRNLAQTEANGTRIDRSIRA